MEKNVGKDIGDKTQHPSRTFGNVDDNFIIEFRSAQVLQRFEEIVRHCKASLEVNEDTMRSLQALNTDLRGFEPGSHPQINWHTVNTTLEQHLQDISRYKRNVDVLLHKIQGRARLVRAHIP